MTLKEIKKKVLQLIEEIDDKHAKLTSDPDIAAKLNSVINQVQFELARMKKIPANTTEEVTADEVFDLNTLDNFYQLRLLRCKNTYGEDSLFETVDNFFNPYFAINLFSPINGTMSAIVPIQAICEDFCIISSFKSDKA